MGRNATSPKRDVRRTTPTPSPPPSSAATSVGWGLNGCARAPPRQFRRGSGWRLTDVTGKNTLGGLGTAGRHLGA